MKFSKRWSALMSFLGYWLIKTCKFCCHCLDYGSTDCPTSWTEIGDEQLFCSLGLASGCLLFLGNLTSFLLFSRMKVLTPLCHASHFGFLGGKPRFTQHGEEIMQWLECSRGLCQPAWAQNLALLLVTYVTLGKFLYFSWPVFSFVKSSY